MAYKTWYDMVRDWAEASAVNRKDKSGERVKPEREIGEAGGGRACRE